MNDRTQAFDRLSDDYRRFRPGYPDSVLDRLRAHVLDGVRDSWPDPWLLLDVGSGTGISTRALRRVLGPGPRVVGVEPGHAMRDAADDGDVEYVDGRAEEVPLPDASAALVLAAQAVHWFDRPAFYAEAARLLVPGGTVAVLSNDRDWTASAFVDAYESLMEEHGDDYRRDYRVFDTVGEMEAQDGLADAVEFTAAWTRELDPDGLVGTALSSSKMAAVVRAIGEERTRAAVTALAAEHFPDGNVRVPHVTRLFLARRVP
ncbi:class I SAM-dependent methyltransferase [Nocardiopsis quinghaiensis]|uniref:class I SAM-dependent methyltransferase n=1 Tax=Nocardiopsis quinghaiensis TaxID=464995 RepID=UPI00123C6D0B|nr:class I SAM-dependent methyltransferase [Nocardiopsis quinghaiensis]